jgi:hypothetical protein
LVIAISRPRGQPYAQSLQSHTAVGADRHTGALKGVAEKDTAAKIAIAGQHEAQRFIR